MALFEWTLSVVAADGSTTFTTAMSSPPPGTINTSGTVISIGRGEDLPTGLRINHKYLSRKHLDMVIFSPPGSAVPHLSCSQLGKNPTFCNKTPMNGGTKRVVAPEEILGPGGLSGSIEFSFPASLNLPTIKVGLVKREASAVQAGGVSPSAVPGAGTTQLVVPTAGDSESDFDEEPPPPVPVSARQVRLEAAAKARKEEEMEQRRLSEKESAPPVAPLPPPPAVKAPVATPAPPPPAKRVPSAVVIDDDEVELIPPPPPPQRVPKKASSLSVSTPVETPSKDASSPKFAAKTPEAAAAPPPPAPVAPPPVAAAPVATATSASLKPEASAVSGGGGGKGKTGWWEWKSNVDGSDDNPKNWKKYMRADAEKLEAAYRKDGGKNAICNMSDTYAVCFDDKNFGMVQFRRDDKSRWRVIRRRGGETVSRPKRRPVRCVKDVPSEDASLVSGSGDDEYEKDSFLASDSDEDSDDYSDSSSDWDDEESIVSDSEDDRAKKRKRTEKKRK